MIYLCFTGGVKFFDVSYARYQDGASATATSGNDQAKFMLTMNKQFRWESIGSNDTITETINIQFPSAQPMNRLFIVAHNLKEFTVKYNGALLDFTNVVGLNGPLGGGIAETVFDLTTAYYEFDEVTVDELTITATKTQVANEEKYINIVIPTSDIGSFDGFPEINNPTLNRNAREAKVLSGKLIVRKGFESFKVDIRFKTYPLQNDIDVISYLYDREESFLVWLCGGRFGPTNFKVEQRGWGLDDIYQVQQTRNLVADYDKNVTTLGANTAITLEETAL